MEGARKLGSIVVSAANIVRSIFATTQEALEPARRKECKRANLFSLLVLLLPGLLSGRAVAAPIVFQGYDKSAASLADAPTAKAASDAFDAATGALTLIDFDTNTTGATLSPASLPSSCGFARCGGNTTADGSGFYGAVHTTTISFASPVDSFGAYFSGWQSRYGVITYTDDSTVTLRMPIGNLLQGGLLFLGFIDAGMSIASITLGLGVIRPNSGDSVGIDDMRFGTSRATVPEPACLFSLGLGLAGLAFSRRREK